VRASEREREQEREKEREREEKRGNESEYLFVVAGEFQPGDESARMLPGARRFQGAQQPAQGQVYLILKLLVCEALSY